MEKYYSAQEISEICGLHIKTVQRFIREGKISAVKVGREWRVTGDALSRFTEGENELFTNEPEEVNNREISAYAHADFLADFGRASSISNMIVASLNSCKQGSGIRFEFVYYQHEKLGRYIFRGDLASVTEMMLFLKEMKAS